LLPQPFFPLFFLETLFFFDGVVSETGPPFPPQISLWVFRSSWEGGFPNVIIIPLPSFPQVLGSPPKRVLAIFSPDEEAVAPLFLFCFTGRTFSFACWGLGGSPPSSRGFPPFPPAPYAHVFLQVAVRVTRVPPKLVLWTSFPPVSDTMHFSPLIEGTVSFVIDLFDVFQEFPPRRASSHRRWASPSKRDFFSPPAFTVIFLQLSVPPLLSEPDSVKAHIFSPLD